MCKILTLVQPLVPLPQPAIQTLSCHPSPPELPSLRAAVHWSRSSSADWQAARWEQATGAGGSLSIITCSIYPSFVFLLLILLLPAFLLVLHQYLLIAFPFLHLHFLPPLSFYHNNILTHLPLLFFSCISSSCSTNFLNFLFFLSPSTHPSSCIIFVSLLFSSPSSSLCSSSSTSCSFPSFLLLLPPPLLFLVYSLVYSLFLVFWKQHYCIRYFFFFSSVVKTTLMYSLFSFFFFHKPKLPEF